MGTCVKHSSKVYEYIQHIVEHRRRCVGGKGLWLMAERLSCQQIDEMLDFVSRSTAHGTTHALMPLAWENNRIPNLSCRACDQFLTLVVEDAYLELIERPLEQKQSPRS